MLKAVGESVCLGEMKFKFVNSPVDVVGTAASANPRSDDDNGVDQDEDKVDADVIYRVPYRHPDFSKRCPAQLAVCAPAWTTVDSESIMLPAGKSVSSKSESKSKSKPASLPKAMYAGYGRGN